MTGAELRALTEATGLSVAWLSKRWDATESTIKNWMLGSHDVPQRISDDVREMVEETTVILDQMIEAAKPGTVLRTYRTDKEYRDGRGDGAPFNAPWHRTLCARVADEVDVTIDWAVPAEKKWRRADATVERGDVEDLLGVELADEQWHALNRLIVQPKQPQSA